jgi:hypothetical protein
MSRKRKRHRFPRAVYGTKDRRFPKCDPEIEAMYPGHLLPASPQIITIADVLTEENLDTVRVLDLY